MIYFYLGVLFHTYIARRHLENLHLAEREKQACFLFCKMGLMSVYAENTNKSSVLSFQFLMFCSLKVLVLQYKGSAWGS